MKCKDNKCGEYIGGEYIHCVLYLKYYLSKCVITKKYPVSWWILVTDPITRCNKLEIEKRIFEILQWKTNRM